MNTLTLRSQMEEQWAFRRYLEEVRRVVLEAYGHQDIPFERVVEEVVAERDTEKESVVPGYVDATKCPGGRAAGRGSAAGELWDHVPGRPNSNCR